MAGLALGWGCDDAAAVTMTLRSGSAPPEIGTIAPPVPAPGTPLGSLYVLDSEIGGGATGRVYRGRRRADDTPIAAKILRAEFTAEPDAVARFLRQRTALYSLDHPHLVRVHDVVSEGDRLAIVMDLIDGEDLRRLVTAGALRVDQRLTVLEQVAAALSAVHAADVVHRDIKPENVLVTWQNAEPFGLLTDFGVARATDGLQLTNTSHFVGTPAYVAPELLAGRPAGPPADLYSLGVTLYEVLAGERPFQAEHPAALLHAHLEYEPTRPPGLTDRLWELLRRCLAKEPADRPPPPRSRRTSSRWARKASCLRSRYPRSRYPTASGADRVASSIGPPAGKRSRRTTRGRTASRRAHDGAHDGRYSAAPAAAVRCGAVTSAAHATKPLGDAIVACVLLGTGAGLWFGRPAEPPAAKQPPSPAPAPYHPYYLPVTATSPRAGTIRLQFSDASSMTGFQYYVIFRDREMLSQVPPDRAPPYVVYSVDRETRHCWTVIALLETDRPPPSAPAKPACKAADGNPTEN